MSRDAVRTVSFFFARVESAAEPIWRPAADVYRTADGWLVKFDLAGVRADDIDLSADGRSLTVRGTRRDLCMGEGVHHQMEIPYSRFERRIDLPVDLRRADITAEARDGMLLVRVRPEV